MAKRERSTTLKEIQVGSYCLVLVRRWPGRRFRVDAIRRHGHTSHYATDRTTARQQAAAAIRELRRSGGCR